MTPSSVAQSRSSDGVEIAYDVRGSGDTAVVLVHGGLANRHFWAPQLEALSARYVVAALDLGGHGESGANRTSWTIASFADDVRAVADTLALHRMVLVGNSLGGPVAIEAAALLRGRVLGVVGVDTFHDLTVRIPADEARRRADAFRNDFADSCRAMTNQLFHAGAEPALRAWAEEQMLATPPAVAVAMMESFADYEVTDAIRRAGVQIRAITGDLWPVNVERNRTVVPDFEVSVVPNAGHYVMLERPVAFNRLLIDVVERLAAGD